MGLPVTALFDLGQKILDAIEDHWPTEAEPLPERRYVSNGMVAWDCESVVVVADNTFGTLGDVAAEQITNDPFAMAIRAAAFGILILRCVPTVNDAGEPPTAAEIETSSKAILADAIAVGNALVDAYEAGEITGCSGLAFERWSSESPDGGFGGGTSRIRVLML